MTLEIQVLAWDRHTIVSGLNWLMRSQPYHLDNWIYNGNTDISKQWEKKSADSLPLKKKKHTKLSDSINMDSTMLRLIRIQHFCSIITVVIF